MEVKVPTAKMKFEDDGRKRCLNVGSGVDYKASNEGEFWVNVDPNPSTEPDVVCSAEQLPDRFEENTFDLVHVIHVWEHSDDLIKFMEAIWAVMKPGGKLVVVCPMWNNENAFADPTHKHVVTRITYSFLSYDQYRKNAEAGSHMSQLAPECDFDINRFAAVPTDPDAKFKDELFAQKHYMNVFSELQAELTCVKPIRRFDIKQFQKRNGS